MKHLNDEFDANIEFVQILFFADCIDSVFESCCCVRLRYLYSVLNDCNETNFYSDLQSLFYRTSFAESNDNFNLL